MCSHARQLALGASRKRKERDGPTTATAKAEPISLSANNRLLAGYLAHEFLTKGTLFGQPVKPPNPTRPEPIKPPSKRLAEPEPGKPLASGYDDVARLMRAEGVHIPGVVNPSQLRRWLQM